MRSRACSGLDDLGRRIQRIALDPAGIEEQLFFRVASPLFAFAGWKAKVRFTALLALFPALREASACGDAKNAHVAYALALAELVDNVEAVERAAIVRKKPAVGYGAWLRRVWELLVAADHALTTLEQGTADEDALRRTSNPDDVSVLPPLGLRPAATTGEEKHDDAAFLSSIATRERVPASDADVRVVELELAAIDHLLAAARGERSLLGRRRRLLVAARQRLLDVSAALPLDRTGERTRASFIAREIVRIDRLETLGLSPDVELAHQARQAIDRGDPRRLYAALAAIDTAARAASDGEVARVTKQAIAKLWEGADPTSAGAVEASLQASASELLGAEVVAAVQEGIETVRAQSAERLIAATNDIERAAADEPLLYFSGAGGEVLRSTVAMDGCFEVGGALGAVRIVEEERFIQHVRHPTQDHILVDAHDAHDLPDAIVNDPRTILLDLAAGRLLARRFVREDVRRQTRVVARSEVRVYVLDGAGSMRGPRARVRDALLVAELATLIARLKAPGEVKCTLFFRYFNEELGGVTRVDSAASAKDAFRDVVTTMHSGGTDIQKALLSSLEQVAVARELDHELTRAQIVLVTDGEAEVDEGALVTARAALGALPIGVSVIVLGQENPALRGFVARQRARGEPAGVLSLPRRRAAGRHRQRRAGARDGIAPAERLDSESPHHGARARERARAARRGAPLDRSRARHRRLRASRRRGAAAPRGRRGIGGRRLRWRPRAARSFVP